MLEFWFFVAECDYLESFPNRFDLMPTFRRDFEEIRARVDKLDPYIQEAHRRTWADDVGMNRLFTGK